MSRVDRFILWRLTSRMAVTVFVIFGLICLVESLSTWRFGYLSELGGWMLGVTGIVNVALLWTLKTLPVSLLLGAIIGLLDLQSRRELTIIRASGISVWRTLRAPIIALTLFGIVVSVLFDAEVTKLNRSLMAIIPTVEPKGKLWIVEGSGQDRYTIVADTSEANGTILNNVTAYLANAPEGEQIRAPRAELSSGAWLLQDAVRYNAASGASSPANVSLPTRKSVGDMGARVSSANDLTLFELWDTLQKGISDPAIKSAVETRLLRLLTLPLAFAGSMVIAFAFTAGYRRTNKYGSAVLYGVVLGFVVYVVTEMAAMAGSAGVLEPLFAATAPALVAIVIGATILLYKEDGRA